MTMKKSYSFYKKKLVNVIEVIERDGFNQKTGYWNY